MVPKPLTRDESQALTRERLLEAAAKVFARQGFEGASLKDVAEEAGYTKGAVFSNFQSKNDLLVALLEACCAASLEEARRTLEGPGPIGARIRQIGDQFASRIARDGNWALLTMELWSCSMRDPELRPRFAAMWEEMRQGLARQIRDQVDAAGVSPALPPDQLAAAAIALSDGLALQMLIDPGRVRPDTVGKSLALLLLTDHPTLSAAELTLQPTEADGRLPVNT